MARATLAGPQREVVFNGLSPLEQQLAQATFARLEQLVTTRVDFFVSQSGPFALELNATIPAMQAYSDIAAHTFLEVVGRQLGRTDAQVQALIEANGSNTKALFDALLAGYGRYRAGQAPDRLAILTRRHDAQLTELGHLARRFTSLGVPTDIVYPDQLSGSDAVVANGRRYPFIYRHLFVRRLEETDLVGADYVKALLAEPNGTRAVVLNPPASQVEVKAVFGYLSEATEVPALAQQAGLTEAEVAAIRQTVPWTRVFRGETLQKHVAQNPDGFVLKRSWDYGGRAVFVGKSRGTEGFTERTQAAYGQPLDWAQVCAASEADRVGGGFVVQRLVPTEPEAHLLCTPQGVQSTSLFVDFSCYASVGLGQQPAWGGVCRGSVQHVVNIVGGGGVLPLLTDDVAAQLLGS
jgi:hypothetical protein